MIVLSVVAISVFTKSTYCDCAGPSTKVATTPLNLWHASSGGMGEKANYSGPDAYGVIDEAYDPSTWSYVNTNDVLPQKLVQLSAVGASVPPGAVSRGKISMPVNRGYVRRGYGTTPQTNIGTSLYENTYNRDMAVGIL